MNSPPANDEVEERLVDLGYEAMCEELNLWNIVGPLENRRPNLPPQEFYNAVRNNKTAVSPEAFPTVISLKSKPHAVACVQWHSLRAALAAVMRELAPIASSIGDDTNG